MKALTLSLTLLIGGAAHSQEITGESAERAAPVELFRDLIRELPFEPAYVTVWPRGSDGSSGASFWSRPRPSANGVTCEADFVAIRDSDSAHVAPIRASRIYRALDPAAGDPVTACAAIRPSGISFFKAESNEIAGAATRLLRELLDRARRGEMPGIRLTCADCEEPSAALVALEDERLIEVVEDRCAPGEGRSFCLEYRFLGPPFGGWRLRTDGSSFAHLIYYGGLSVH